MDLGILFAEGFDRGPCGGESRHGLGIEYQEGEAARLGERLQRAPEPARGGGCWFDQDDRARSGLEDEPVEGEDKPSTRANRPHASDLPGVDDSVGETGAVEADGEEAGFAAGWMRFKHRGWRMCPRGASRRGGGWRR